MTLYITGALLDEGLRKLSKSPVRINVWKLVMDTGISPWSQKKETLKTVRERNVSEAVRRILKVQSDKPWLNM